MPIATDTPMTYPTYTNRNLDDGVFEQLMAAVKHHIGEEYKAQRISADQYAQVYLGLTEACLTQSTQYLLGLLLLDEKRRGADLQNQKAEYELEVILPLEVEKLQKEIEKITAEISLMGKQEDKIDKEIEFMTYKILTERANTEEGIADPGSMIGKQLALLTAQRLGFAGDIQTKIAKMYADYDAILQSVQEVETQITLQPLWTDSLLESGAEGRGIIDEAEDIAAEIRALT